MRPTLRSALAIVEADLSGRLRRDDLLFIGHFALGFEAKRAAPRLSLAVLFAGAQLAPTVPVLIVSAVVGAALLLIWALWFDRHRTPIT
jgi:hypothetical protein